MAATGIATDMTKGVASVIIPAVMKQIKDIVELDKTLHLLNTDFGVMNSTLHDIEQKFQYKQRGLPKPVGLCLGTMNDHLQKGQLLFHGADEQRKQCFGCCLLCNCKLFSELKDWKISLDQLFKDLERACSITSSTDQILYAPKPPAEVLPQNVSEATVAASFESAQEYLQTWLTKPDHSEAYVIGIYGKGGVGKTSLLKAIHNNYTDKVRDIFDIVIWYTVSKCESEEEDVKIKELQFSIAHTLHIDLNDIDTLDKRRMKLSDSLENRRFLLILDNLCSQIDLYIVGIEFYRDKGSKVLISSRSRSVIKTMVPMDHHLNLKSMSAEQGWELFWRKASANGVVSEKEIETIAKEIATECKGNPLALNVVAAALSSERDVNKWRDALAFMRSVDAGNSDMSELNQPLEWSYNDLPNHLKECFLYCAAFPEDAEIDVETLVEMWTAEGFLIPTGMTQLLDAGSKFVAQLVSRCLIEYVGLRKIIPFKSSKVGVEKEVIKVHNVLRDLAISIGQRDDDWVYESGKHLQQFPHGEVTRNCKRLSVSHNDIEQLPTDLECTKLRCLVLAHNKKLSKVPEDTFSNIMSLKVLDLSCTLITSLPKSVEQLRQLVFLNLSGCHLLNELPESICSLSLLQFLKLNYCESLISLPDKIADLKNLKHFSFEIQDKRRSMVIPRHIFVLTSMTKLCLPMWRPGCAIDMENLQNLSNLMELSIAVKVHTMNNCDREWLKKMRKLTLRCARRDDAPENANSDSNVAVHGRDADRYSVMCGDEHDVDILPPLVQDMNELRSLTLFSYWGVSLPSYICKFPNLERLELRDCLQLSELPVLEIGGDNASASFPKLKKLKIWNCPLLKRLPIGMEKLCNLGAIRGPERWWSNLIWEDEAARLKLQPLFKPSWWG